MEHKAQKGASIEAIVNIKAFEFLSVGVIALSARSTPSPKGLRVLEAIVGLDGLAAALAAHLIPVLWVGACLLALHAYKDKLRHFWLVGFIWGVGIGFSVMFFLEPGARIVEIFNHNNSLSSFGPAQAFFSLCGVLMVGLGISVSAMSFLPKNLRNDIRILFTQRDQSQFAWGSVGVIAAGVFVIAISLVDTIAWGRIQAGEIILIATIIGSTAISIIANVLVWRRMDEMEKQFVYRGSSVVLSIFTGLLILIACIETIFRNFDWSHWMSVNLLVVCSTIFGIIDGMIHGRSDPLSPDCQDNERQTLRAGFY